MICSIARNAGLAAMQHYQCETAVSYKSGLSPVTAADLAVEGIIVHTLQQLTPQIPIISEESPPRATTDTALEHFWQVDPIDGTKEFLSGSGEFTVNITLIKKRISVLGVVYAPALDMLYYGQNGDVAWCEHQGSREIISCRQPPPDGLILVANCSHNDASTLEQFLLGIHVRQHGVITEILSCRQRPSRSLPPPRPYHGMGHHGRTCRTTGSRRQLSVPKRWDSSALWETGL